MAPLGFIGLGTMGRPIALRLLNSGHTVTGTGRTPHHSASLLSAGLNWAEHPREVASRCTTLLCMPRDPEAFAAVTYGKDGLLLGLRPGSVVVDLSTNHPSNLIDLDRELAQRQCHLIAAPVTGTPQMAMEGHLSMMTGGSSARIQALNSVFRCFAASITYVGTPSQAAVLKLAINLSVAIQFIGFAEGMVLAEKSGVQRTLAVQVFLESAMASPMLIQRGPFILDSPSKPWADISLAQKDLSLALDMARRLEVPLPLSALANELANAAAALGYAQQDIAALWAPLAILAGIGPEPEDHLQAMPTDLD